MFNSPTKCQYYVNQSLQKLCDAFPKFMITHFMDDMIFAQLDAHFEVMMKQLLVFFKNMAYGGLRKFNMQLLFNIWDINYRKHKCCLKISQYTGIN